MCALNTTLRQQRCGLMAACVCIYLLNAALHHAGATAQELDECFAGFNGFKSSGTSNPGACSACCYHDDGNFSHCCGLRTEAARGRLEEQRTCLDDETPVLCIEPCPPDRTPDSCAREAFVRSVCCPFPGEFTDPDFQEEHF